MRVINRARAGGKTIQLLYLSDFHQWPVICFDRHACDNLENIADRFGLNIPKPIPISEIKRAAMGANYDGYLMDESIYCIQELFDKMLGKDKLKAITMAEPYINKRWDGRKDC